MRYIFIGLLALLFVSVSAQSDNKAFRVMWYNVENLFDTEDDPLTNDEEFLPTGNRRWTNKRYNHKLQQIAKTINAAGEWSTPAIIGMCEVENDSVLTHLLTRTPLRKQHYRYCITTGSDTRGINVGILYQRDKFAYISHQSVPVVYREGRKKPTRDILHLTGKIISGDTLDILACHFPSRSGGEKESEAFRLDAAIIMRQLCDSLLAVRQSPNLILMGDFNDTPKNRSIVEVLKAVPLLTEEESINTPLREIEKPPLYNLFANPNLFQFPGSHKYRGEWSQLDQIIVNHRLISKDSSFHVIPESIQIFTPKFLLTKDKTERGYRPKRTYFGFKYEGGFSDHLPLIVDFSFR